MKLVYILVGDSGSFYARMAVVSVLSVRSSNPTAPLMLVVDRQTEAFLKRNHKDILDIVDACLAVDVPDKGHQWQSRFLKTSLGSIIEGPFLFLDTDTLVRRSVIPLFKGSWDIAAGVNHSAATKAQQIWSGDRETIEAMSWNLGDSNYLNSGVIFYAGNSASKKFAEAWHKAWLESWGKTGNHRDQPAFNHALRHTAVCVGELPDLWNAQITSSPTSAFDAGIWHFYFSLEHSEETAFSRLVEESKTGSLATLRRSLSPVLLKRTPWTVKSDIHHVEITIWEAYRRGVRLRWGEVGLLLGRRVNWKNVLLALFASLGLSYRHFAAFLDWSSRCKRRLTYISPGERPRQSS